MYITTQKLTLNDTVKTDQETVTPAATASTAGTHESAVAVPITAPPARRGRSSTAGVRVARPRNPSIHHGREPCANGCTRP